MEAAKVPVEDQDAKPETPILVSLWEMISIMNLHLKCLECKYILYYWHLLFVSGLGQCYDTTHTALLTLQFEKLILIFGGWSNLEDFH